MTDQITNIYGAVDGFHGDLMALHGQFLGIQEEIQSAVHQLNEVWLGASSEGHQEWQANFDRITAEIQSAAAQAFNVLNNEVGSGGALQQHDISAASQFA